MKRWQTTVRGKPKRRQPWLGLAILASCMGMTGIPAVAEQAPAERQVTDARGNPVSITRYALEPGADRSIPYPGSVPLTRRDFPAGFPLSLGSGIALKNVDGGKATFWVLSDRGPNGDGPNVEGEDSKVFPAPRFTPAFGQVRIIGDKIELLSLTSLQGNGRPLTGLPHAASGSGATREVPLNDQLQRLPSDNAGIDPEAIAWDGTQLWVADEYTPAVLRVDPVTGKVGQRLTPGDGLPTSFARRRNNRGMEALTWDARAARLYGALQSNLDESSSFIHWAEIDPANHGIREFVYPIEPGDYWKGNPSHAKLGDMTALGGGQFVVIEEGKSATGREIHRLYRVDSRDATDIQSMPAVELEDSSMTGRREGRSNRSSIKPLRKSLLIDLDQAGWTAEKAEGLALVDDHTLALTNDNDFGLTSVLVDKAGQTLDGKVEKCRVNPNRQLSGDQCPKGAASVAITALPATAARQQFWLLRCARPLRDD